MKSKCLLDDNSDFVLVRHVPALAWTGYLNFKVINVSFEGIITFFFKYAKNKLDIFHEA